MSGRGPGADLSVPHVRIAEQLVRDVVVVPSHVETPAVVVDYERLGANVQSMACELAARGVELRPHFKSHKTVADLAAPSHAGQPASPQRLWPRRKCSPTGVHRSLRGVPVVRGAREAGAVAAAARGDSSAGRVRLRSRCRCARRGGGRLRGAARGARRGRLWLRANRRRARARRRAREVPRHATTVCGSWVRSRTPATRTTIPTPTRSAPPRTTRSGRCPSRGRHWRPTGIGPPSRVRVPPRRLCATACGIVTEERPGTYVFGDRQLLGLGAMRMDQLALVVAATVGGPVGARPVRARCGREGARTGLHGLARRFRCSDRISRCAHRPARRPSHDGAVRRPRSVSW